MRRSVLALGFVLCFCGFIRAQDVPRAEVFGGYSYVNVDTNGLTSRQSASGWEASVSGNFNRWFAVEGDVSAYYKTYPVDLSILGLLGTVNVHVHDFGFLGGPRINLGQAFVHGLIGGDHLSGSVFGGSASQDSLAGAFGGGVVWPLSGRLAARASGDYVFTRHNILGGPSVTQNNFRVSAGFVYRFGIAREGGSTRSDRTPRTPRSTVSKEPPPGCDGIGEAALLGVIGCPSDSGFLVTSVHAGSPAAQLGIKPGDIVTNIDGRAVHTSRDIEAAAAASTTGTVKISFMIRGAWLTEQDVKVR